MERPSPTLFEPPIKKRRGENETPSSDPLRKSSTQKLPTIDLNHSTDVSRFIDHLSKNKISTESCLSAESLSIFMVSLKASLNTDSFQSKPKCILILVHILYHSLRSFATNVLWLSNGEPLMNQDLSNKSPGMLVLNQSLASASNLTYSDGSLADFCLGDGLITTDPEDAFKERIDNLTSASFIKSILSMGKSLSFFSYMKSYLAQFFLKKNYASLCAIVDGLFWIFLPLDVMERFFTLQTSSDIHSTLEKLRADSSFTTETGTRSSKIYLAKVYQNLVSSKIIGTINKINKHFKSKLLAFKAEKENQEIPSLSPEEAWWGSGINVRCTRFLRIYLEAKPILTSFSSSIVSNIAPKSNNSFSGSSTSPSTTPTQSNSVTSHSRGRTAIVDADGSIIQSGGTLTAIPVGGAKPGSIHAVLEELDTIYSPPDTASPGAFPRRHRWRPDLPVFKSVLKDLDEDDPETSEKNSTPGSPKKSQTSSKSVKFDLLKNETFEFKDIPGEDRSVDVRALIKAKQEVYSDHKKKKNLFLAKLEKSFLRHNASGDGDMFFLDAGAVNMSAPKTIPDWLSQSNRWPYTHMKTLGDLGTTPMFQYRIPEYVAVDNWIDGSSQEKSYEGYLKTFGMSSQEKTAQYQRISSTPPSEFNPRADIPEPSEPEGYNALVHSVSKGPTISLDKPILPTMYWLYVLPQDRQRVVFLAQQYADSYNQMNPSQIQTSTIAQAIELPNISSFLIQFGFSSDPKPQITPQIQDTILHIFRGAIASQNIDPSIIDGPLLNKRNFAHPPPMKIFEGNHFQQQSPIVHHPAPFSPQFHPNSFNGPPPLQNVNNHHSPMDNSNQFQVRHLPQQQSAQQFTGNHRSRICQYFTNLGGLGCRFGNECTFLHPVHINQMPSNHTDIRDTPNYNPATDSRFAKNN